MTQQLFYLTDDVNWFPSPDNALKEPAGLLAVGGDLSVPRLRQAYNNGIFPWYSEGEPFLWWSPDPRAVIIPNEIRVNKSLRKFLKKCDYTVTMNQCFSDVVQHCAEPREDDGTWIFPEMMEAYTAMHKQGYAHSIEVWSTLDNQPYLVGGLYGVLTGRCFSGESMFSFKPNASKVALMALAEILAPYEGALIDCQIANPYLMSMGAKTVSRDWFLESLAIAGQNSVPKHCFSEQHLLPSCLTNTKSEAR